MVLRSDFFLQDSILNGFSLQESNLDGVCDDTLQAGLRKSIGLSRQLLHVVPGDAFIPFLEMYLQNLSMFILIREVDVEDFVEAVLSQKLGWQCGNVIGGGKNQHRQYQIVIKPLEIY